MGASFESGGYRPEVRRYGGREVEVVSGKSYSAANPSTYVPQRRESISPEYSVPRRKEGGRSRASSSSSGSIWCFSDPEMKRRKRVASYKVYSVEGKMKSSFRRGIRWIKKKCSHLVHG